MNPDWVDVFPYFKMDIPASYILFGGFNPFEKY